MKSFLMLAILISTSAWSQVINITASEIMTAQNEWGDGIVQIGKVYQEGGDYRQEALAHILKSYDYTLGTVLFKPTLASQTPFRPTVEGALSYFVGGNDKFPEDDGFAIKP